MLDLRRMMLLCDLAELGTVTAVADRRSITSSAVSQQLRVLEDEVGATLFRRDGRTLGLTRGGVVLADHARRVLGAVDEAMSAVAATADRNSGNLVVASFNMGISMLAAPMVARLAADAADIKVQLRQENRGAALRLLRQGELDLAITCDYGYGGHESLAGLVEADLFAEPLVLLAPQRTHLAVHNAGISALADHAWVTAPQGTGLGTAVLRAGERAGFTPRIVHRLVGARNICDLAATGVGPAIVPALSVPEELESLVVDGVDVGERRLSVVMRSGRQHDPNTAVALDTLRAISDEIRPRRPQVAVGVAS